MGHDSAFRILKRDLGLQGKIFQMERKFVLRGKNSFRLFFSSGKRRSERFYFGFYTVSERFSFQKWFLLCNCWTVEIFRCAFGMKGNIQWNSGLWLVFSFSYHNSMFIFGCPFFLPGIRYRYTLLIQIWKSYGSWIISYKKEFEVRAVLQRTDFCLSGLETWLMLREVKESWDVNFSNWELKNLMRIWIRGIIFRTYKLNSKISI